jgi:hypothetical protein
MSLTDIEELVKDLNQTSNLQPLQHHQVNQTKTSLLNQQMYPQQQQQQISNTNNQFQFHHYHFYPQTSQQLDQASVYSQLQPFQQYPHQKQHQVNQTYTTNQPIHSQQQIVFQPPINQPAEPTDDQIRQSKVVKRGNELSNENKKSAKRAKLDRDQKSKEEKEEIAYKELNERIKKERLVNQAYDDELFECIQNYVKEYRKAEKLKKIKDSELQTRVNFQISSQNKNLNMTNENTVNIKSE